MLDSLRSFAKSWPGKIMGGFLLVGVAGFGINNVIMDLGSNTVARVGDEDISSRNFMRAYQNQMNAIAQQIGQVPSAEQAMSMGIPTMALQSLAQDSAITQMAKGMGLGVSDDQLSKMLRQDPSFQNAVGTFNPQSFSQVLQMSGITEAEYFEDQSNAARRQQLVLSLFGDTTLPAVASNLVNRYAADKRAIDYFTLNDTNVETPAEPTEEELATYLTEHQSEFRTVPTRKVQMLRLSAADLAATKTISDDQIAAEYERTKDSLNVPERRTIQQVALTTDQTAAFEAGLAAGTPFATLLTETGATATDLGTLTQASITDASLATTAFGLADGSFAIIDGIGGKRAVHVSAIEAGGVPALADVREQISTNLALAEARNELADIQDQIEELRAAFRPLTEIAQRYGLDLYEADVTSTGSQLSIIPDLASEDRGRVVQAIFSAQQGALTPAISLAGNANLWFDLESVEDARDQTLDEVRDAVVSAINAERLNNAIMAAQADAVARLDNGEAIADIAASYNVFPQISQPFARFGSDDGTIDGAVASAVFAGGADHHGSAVSQDGEFVVFQVVDVTAAEGPLEAQANTNLENELRVGIYGEFVSAITNEAGLRINQQALEQTLTLNTGL